MVLCGYRPIPKFRNISYESRSEVIDAMAKRSLVSVDTFILNNKYVSEIQMMRKAVDDAWNTSKTHVLNMSWGECIINGIVLSWERIYQMVGWKIFSDFIELAGDLLECDVLTMMCSDVFERLSFIESPSKKDFLERLKMEKGVSPFRYLLMPSNSGKMEGAQTASCQGNKALLAPMVRFGVSKITRLYGNISVEVTDEELDLFKQGSGNATLLDGGFVRIDQIVDGKEESFELYKKGKVPYENV